MNKNKGIKVALVILVVVCVIQAGALSAVSSRLESVDERLSLVEKQARYTENALAELEAVIDINTLGVAQMDIIGADFSSGEVEFKFYVTPANVNDNTRVVVSNTIDSVELKKNGSSYEGSLRYPMNTETYETRYYVYDGEYERGNEYIDFVGATQWASKVAYAYFDGMTAYGNNKLTLAGSLSYHLYADDEIKSAKLVFKDNTMDLGSSSEGEVQINFSEKVEKNDNDCIRDLYIEFEMASGYVYQVYPMLNAGCTYQLQGGGEDMTEAVSQSEELNVTTDDGIAYQMSIDWY